MFYSITAVRVIIIAEISLILFVSGDMNMKYEGNCGQLELGRNNVNTPLSQVPWSVYFYYINELGERNERAGAIINPWTILTDGNGFLSKVKGESKLRIRPFESYKVVSGFNDIIGSPSEENLYDVSYIKTYSKFNMAEHWAERLWDLAVIHLKRPIQFGNKAQALCLPVNEDHVKNLTISKDLKEEIGGNAEIRLGGWPYPDSGATTNEIGKLHLKIQSFDFCEDFWTDSYTNDSYLMRICAKPTNEIPQKCINKDSGMAIQEDGKYFFTGFTNNFYYKNGCKQDSLYILSVIDEHMLQWCKWNILCGPDKFACDNGQCLPLDNMCDQVPQCADSSDEEPNYCRGLNYCSPDQFACGVYGKCIDKSKHCDDITDCEMGEDETSEFGCLQVIRSKPLYQYLLEIGGSLLIVFIMFGTILYYIRKRYLMIGNLTKEEIEEFKMGKLNSQKGSIEAMPYDSEYEIQLDNLKFNLSEELGSGNFGIVYKGSYANKGSEEETVAVKTIKNQGDLELLKDLLLEIKIMIYVGKHDYIVNLIGAYTKNIQCRTLFVVLEYCSLGSLKDYLEKNQSSYYVNQETQNTSYVRLRAKPEYTFSDLCRWSKEIADGMYHLSSKKIVHGDLATRNVLLNENRVAKISDFGLSIKLYEKEYLKDDKRQIPWRWMSLETLQYFKFSTHTDVWSYGVTMWEIFSLGNIPFSGRNYDDQFVQDLINGLRLGKPNEATNEAYEIMLRCWIPDPNGRPNFEILSKYSVKALTSDLILYTPIKMV